ncbi:hypothetical protein BJX70DRAFT_401878 [Aspergillus crustosus]
MALYRDVLGRAAVDPHSVSYVEAHGTGTRVGDPIEVEGIRQVLGGHNMESVLHIGGVKPSIGHSEEASGVIALIKVLLMMKHGKIPAQAHFNTLNPNIADLKPDQKAIATSLRSWTDDLQVALVNNYGASGSNAAAVVVPPHVRTSVGSVSPSESASTWPIFISARSHSSLVDYCTKLKGYIGRKQNTIDQLAFALATKQNRKLQHSLCTTVSSLGDLQSQLLSPETHISISQTPRPIVLLFGGQNGNTIPAARSLYESSLLFRSRLRQCEEVMRPVGLPSPVPVVLDGLGHSNQDIDLVLRHAALFSQQYACGMSWIDSGVTPQAICGHSFGEWAALTVSGALTLEAGIKLESDNHQGILGCGHFTPLGQQLARASSPISVYALNSPFTTFKSKVDINLIEDVPTVEEMATSYISEIKRRQPTGPYQLGGYSFGGIVAYEAARQLLEAGDQVAKLLLIDVACLTFVTCPPNTLVEHLHSNLPPGVGLNKTRDNSKTESDLASGEDGIILARHQLRKYQTSNLPGPSIPKTILVSAKHGLSPRSLWEINLDLQPREQRIAEWFLDDRVDDGPLGWEELLGEGSVQVVRADANHFNVVLPRPGMVQWVSKVVELLGA